MHDRKIVIVEFEHQLLGEPSTADYRAPDYFFNAWCDGTQQERARDPQVAQTITGDAPIEVPEIEGEIR